MGQATRWSSAGRDVSDDSAAGASKDPSLLDEASTSANATPGPPHNFDGAEAPQPSLLSDARGSACATEDADPRRPHLTCK